MTIESGHIVSVLEGSARIYDKAIFCVVLNTIGSVLSVRGMTEDNVETELGTVTTDGSTDINQIFILDLSLTAVTCVWYKIVNSDYIDDIHSVTMISRTGAPVLLGR